MHCHAIYSERENLQIAQYGHQYIVKIKELLRTKVWWPSIDKQVEEFIKTCLPCQATGIAKPPTPPIITRTPTFSFTHGLLWSFPNRRDGICSHR